MGPFAALNSVTRNAFRFAGRAPRSEYWWFFLWDVIIGLCAVAFDIWSVVQATGPAQDFSTVSLNPMDYIVTYWALLSFLPRMAVTVRRLHDAGFSGWFYLLYIIPLGGIVIFVMTLFPSTQDHTSYGPPHSPLGGTPRKDASGKPHNPMQGYAYLDIARQKPTPQMQAQRKAQMRALYEQRVLGKATPAQ